MKKSGFVLIALVALLGLMACTTETVREVPVEKVVIREVIKEVPVEKIVEVEKTVIETIEVEVPVEVVKEVIREVEKPGEVIVVTKEVVKEVPVEVVVVREVVKEVKVPGETIVVEKIVIATPVAMEEPGLTDPLAESKPPGATKQSGGAAVYASRSAGQFYGGLNSQGPMRIGHEFVCEDLFTPTKDGDHVGLIAESWTLHDDLTGATVKIHEGAMLHQGYGELTAQDVAWSYNDANPGTNPESVTDGSGDYKGFLGTEEQKALDKYTVELNWTAYDPRWNSFFFGEDGLHACIYSEKAFLEHGGYDDTSWQFENQVGTGPFELVDFVRDDHFTFENVADHWRKVPQITKMTQINVPDNAVRLAMMETGQADIGSLSGDLFGLALRGGFASASAGGGSMYAMWFPGNLWEENHPVTGEKLERNTYVHDIPWIGNPIQASDPDNPAGMDDMEQARLVREAMAWAIDRELLVEVILLGNGSVQHSVHYDSRDPLWESRWEFGFDKAKAESMLDRAGFPRGKGDWRFQMPMYGWSGGGLALMTDAVAGMLRDVGIEVTVNHYQYSVWRPSVVTRSATMPWLDGWSAMRPYDEPIAAQCSAVTRGGKSRGAEAAECTKAYLAMGAELDYDKRLDIAREFATWNRNWVLQFGIASGNNALVVNPEYIDTWEMYLGRRYVVNSWENITLK